MQKYTVFSGVFSFLILSFQLYEGRAIEPEKSTTSLKKILEESDKVEPTTESIVPQSEGCQNVDYSWNCCTVFRGKYIHTTAVCITIAYHPKEYGMELNITIGGDMIIHEDFSLRNPPPLCFNVPLLKSFASACFRFYNLNEGNMTFSGCIDFEGFIEYLDPFESKVGCFKIHWTG